MRKLSIATVALCTGSLIYLLWRSDSLNMFVWLDRLGLEKPVVCVRHCASSLSVCLPGWLLFSLPNGLWFFAGMLLFDSIWGSRLTGKILWISAFSAVALGSEIAQGLRLIPGTLDWQDLALMCVGACLALLVGGDLRRRKGEPNDDSSKIKETRPLVAYAHLPDRTGSWQR